MEKLLGLIRHSFTALLGISSTLFFVTHAYAQPSNSARPIVVELFTSQGCSSCPPADQFLETLVTQHSDTVLALSYHVDYWNYIGWKDPFSDALYTQRQYQYGHLFGLNSVYTPQMVIDGRLETTGSRRHTVYHYIQQAKKHVVDIPFTLRKIDQLFIDLPYYPNLEDEVRVVVIGFNSKHHTKVTRGENRGRSLTNYNIVTDIHYAADWAGNKYQITTDIPTGENIAVLLQSKQTGRILGARLLSR